MLTRRQERRCSAVGTVPGTQESSADGSLNSGPPEWPGGSSSANVAPDAVAGRTVASLTGLGGSSDALMGSRTGSSTFERILREFGNRTLAKYTSQVESMLREHEARLAELLRERDDGVLDAAEVARWAGRSREWVYRHKAELGGVKLGNGPRPRWGFPPAAVRAYLDGGR
jgi:hypothetical protein